MTIVQTNSNLKKHLQSEETNEMDREQAIKMIEELLAWVPSGIFPGNLKQLKKLKPAWKSPATPKETVKLFVKALYAAGYEIRKKEK